MDENIKTIICRNLKMLRIRNGYAQEKVAIMLDMEQNTYSRLERGETKLDIERLQKIADLYGISVYQLLNEIPPEN